MGKAKYVCSPLAGHFKLTSEHYPTSEKEKQEMRGVPYALAVGSLMYAMVCTRPYIACVVGVVSWQRTLDLPVLQVYADADMAGDVNSRKSLLGYLLTFAGGAVSWQSRL